MSEWRPIINPKTGQPHCPKCNNWLSLDGDYYCPKCGWVEPEPEEK